MVISCHTPARSKVWKCGLWKCESHDHWQADALSLFSRPEIHIYVSPYQRSHIISSSTFIMPPVHPPDQISCYAPSSSISCSPPTNLHFLCSPSNQPLADVAVLWPCRPFEIAGPTLLVWPYESGCWGKISTRSTTMAFGCWWRRSIKSAVVFDIVCSDSSCWDDRWPFLDHAYTWGLLIDIMDKNQIHWQALIQNEPVT